MTLMERLAVVVDSEAGGVIRDFDKIGISAERAAAKVQQSADAQAAAQAKVRLAQIASERAAIGLAKAQQALDRTTRDSNASDEQKQAALLQVRTAEVRAGEATRLLGLAERDAARLGQLHSRALAEQAVAAQTATRSLSSAKVETAALAKTIRGGVVSAAAVGGLAVAAFGVKAVGAASDLGESTSKAGVLFGKSVSAVEEFGNIAAKSFGQSRAEATEAVGVFGNLFIAMGIGQKQSADLSINLTKLASDLASFNNSSPEEALEALRSGLLGEAEPLRKFGVQLSAARVQEEGVRLGLIKQANDVLPAAGKAQAAYSLIMKDTAVAQGDFGRTSTGLANQQRILTAQFKDFAAAAGGIALPAATKLFSAINAGIGPITDLLSATEGGGKFVRDFGLSFIALAGGLAIAKKAMDLLSASEFGSKIKEQFTEALAGATEAAAVSGRSVGTVTKVGAGMTALARAIGPVGLALSAGAALLAFFGQKSKEADARVDDLTASIREQGGVVSKTNRETAAKILADNGLLDAANKVGLSTKELTSAYLGNQDARRKVNDVVDAGLAIYSKDFAAGKINAHLTNEQIKAYFLLNDTLPGVIDAFDKSAEAQIKLASASEDATKATVTWNSVAETAKEKLDAQKAAADRLKVSIDLLSGANIDVTQAQIAYAKAQTELTQGTKDNEKAHRGTATSLDVSTEAGQRNLTNIVALAQASGSYATAIANRANSEEEGRKVLSAARAEFIRQATQLGFTKTEVDRLARAYFGIPKYIKTDIELKIDAAKKQAAEIQKTITQIKGKRITVEVTQDGGVQRVQREINAITGKAVSITVNPGAPNAKIGRSRGGEVTGGVPGRDSVPALLMPGERVLTVAENRAYRLRLAQPGAAGGSSGATTNYTININASPLTNPAEIGRATVAAIRAYEQRSGTDWRR